VDAVLVDAGPLIAILDKSDRLHEDAVDTLRTIRDPLITVWPAFAEAMYLLGDSWPAQEALWNMLLSSGVQLAHLSDTDARRMKELMKKYREQPMDLADAGLVRVAEREGYRRIFTFDRHFRTYRVARGGALSVIPG
jgi:predicted nucleic acid-binding protein